MATNKVLQVYGTQLLFRDVTDFPNSGAGPATTAAGDLLVGTPTQVQIDLTSVSAGSARQSAKTATLADTGSAWPIQWVFGATMENLTAPADGGTYDFYWNASPNATAASGNSANATGSDAAYTVAGLAKLISIGSMTCENQAINTDTDIGTIWMPHLYGSLIVINNTSTAVNSTVDECHVTATPIIPDVQAAA